MQIVFLCLFNNVKYTYNYTLRYFCKIKQININVYMGELRVKEILKEKGIMQKELAVSIGVAEISLSRSINGNPSLDTLNRIAEALQVPISELFEQPSTDTINCPHCGGKIKVSKD